MKTITGDLQGKGLRFGIAISRFNDLLTKNLLEAAVDGLVRHGVHSDDITVVWVPGAFELPTALKQLASSGKFHALIALGVVIQGATGHAEIINRQVASACTQIALETGVPVIDSVIGAQNIDQAMERAGTKHGNRGWSAAETALEMAGVMKKLRTDVT
jgi:6,7-dimethyl-8-ribityllumazine synthase